ncbi:MAG: bifunctional folylpolyglutamate synthase/dihydrofolate synthase [Gallionellaceae bacterium]|nr:bifunctional folylpolyglutamate synthase/dihydrofolate synthase [Gallionellaceae bacterium]
MPQKLADWLSHLESLHPKTIALGLERVVQVKQRLNLQPNFPVIIVGGTNGKGSVCAMLEAMLHAAGYRVGCYTSPHLLAYNERVRIEKKQASDEVLCAAFERVEQARNPSYPLPLQGGGLGWGSNSENTPPSSPSPCKGEGTNSVGHAPEISLTYFEFGTLAAMQCFVERKVEVAILEVGLGGRLDAVNVFDHDCAVVTSVDIDHTDYLGDTREQIAFEKAGIFRAGKVAIFGDPDMPAAIASEAQRIGAQLWRLGEQFSFTAGMQQWNYRGMAGTRSALPLPALRGAYQLHNASTALAVLDALKVALPVSMEAVRRGLVEVGLPGRFQVVPGRPLLILDVAHNPHAARSLAHNLADMPPCPRTFAVFAMLRDKDIAGVVHALNDQIDAWLVAGIAVPRGATGDELVQVLRDEGVKGAVLTFATVTAALQHACNEASENDRIAAFGSFYTVAEVMHTRGLRYA